MLLTDVVLPGMDGSQLARLVTRDRPGTQVLSMSGYARGVGSRAVHLDPDRQLLEKPFSGQALLERVRQLLDTAPKSDS
jgi:CheY-like chemotaxis protein